MDSNSKFNTITFCRDDYVQPGIVYPGSVDQVDFDKMFDDISAFIRIALKNGYQMRVWGDGLTVAVEYQYADPSMCGVSLEWLDEDEYIVKATDNDDTDKDE